MIEKRRPIKKGLVEGLVWSSTRQCYFRENEPLSDSAILSLVEQIARKEEEDARALSTRLLYRQVDMLTWCHQMSTAIRHGYQAMAVLAHGGPELVSLAAWETVMERIQIEEDHLYQIVVSEWGRTHIRAENLPADLLASMTRYATQLPEVYTLLRGMTASPAIMDSSFSVRAEKIKTPG